MGIDGGRRGSSGACCWGRWSNFRTHFFKGIRQAKLVGVKVRFAVSGMVLRPGAWSPDRAAGPLPFLPFLAPPYLSCHTSTLTLTLYNYRHAGLPLLSPRASQPRASHSGPAHAETSRASWQGRSMKALPFDQ